MKLRLHDNTLRFRLSRSEVAELGESGRLQAFIHFLPGQALGYSLESCESAEISAALEDHQIRVKLPRAEVKQWVESDRTGIEGSLGALRVLVEKDFACLHHTSSENADAFPNPLIQKR